MTDHEKYRNFWHRIEKQAFSPSKAPKDQQKWLKACVKHFYKQLEPNPNKHYILEKALKNRSKHNPFEIKIPIPGWPVNCRIELGDITPQKFSFSLDWTNRSDGEAKKTIRFDYDRTFDYWNEENKPTSSPKSSTNKKKPKDDCSTKDIEKILSSRILHPSLHLHPEFRDDIRIVLNETNPFVFLYQLLFQLLVLVGEERRTRELKRMVAILYEKREMFEVQNRELFTIK